VLTYHVVSGKVAAKQVVDLKGAKTLNGQRIDITVANGTVSVDKAKVVTTDIECSNGIIHVIDSVILPSADNIATTADKAGTFKTLLAAAKAAGLATALSGEAELTVFAPTDEAFAKLPAGTVESLLKPENKAKLAGILKYHVVTGRVYSEDAVQAKVATTLQGSTIAITLQDGKARVNDANLVATDIDASNGVIHVIDSVMLPPESKKVTAVEASQLILGAIAQGAPTYNAGHHEACAQLYMTTASSLVSDFRDLPPHVVTNLKHVVTQAQHTSCPTDRVWTLRNGLDQAYISMTNVR
jgi:transforming growth factor-beta-induced protein